MRTLAELNATPHRKQWGGCYDIEIRYAVGKVGPSWKQGAKVHLIRQEIITGYIGDYQPKPNQYKQGSVFSADAPCNSNGQHTGRAVDGWDTDRITCSRCLKAAG